jgi:hypothetical protein
MKQEYIVVHGETPEDLSALVNENAEQGWELWGNPFVAIVEPYLSNMHKINNYCQSMVRFDIPLISDVGKIDITASADLPIAHSIQIPETPDPLEGTIRRIVQRAVPLFYGQLCCCTEWVGDNPDCRVHNPLRVSGVEG